ncbi:nickel-dependent lactate racemase [Dethiobacter alkaliphilus]|uniref:nickel-dependent lactate racemase n=1 Tax=Dethiobacter alkaliphilus TaxID=427926 RepID=UPI002225CE2B|nr:nickel-dependent lactate racemase [Dethiobacter alkaliphilus]MCW3490009.1 nickel-dependent lactate racemase [Dethiobacter alkaliphilus]
MNFSLGFCKGTVEIIIEEKNLLSVLEPNPVEASSNGAEEVKRAMFNPIGTNMLKNIVKAGEKVAIVTSDITRPMPSKIVLPVVLKEIYEANIPPSDITIVFALGSHRKHTEEEKRYLVGDEVFETVRCIDSDMNDCVSLGVTSFGTPVDIFTPVANADRRICLGNIEFHYFAGYSGGAKAIMPGVSTRAAIQANHSKMVQDEARAGEMTLNPVRGDIEEVVKFVPIDFIVNVVLNERKEIMKAVAGHYFKAHREGCRFLDRLYKVQIPQKADIVIVSPGGYPKDINIYQAQKALDNAKHAVREGGIIILTASCKEGYGEGVFERWIKKAEAPGEMVEEIQRNFELGGHKAAAIAMVLAKSDVFLVSELSEEVAQKTFMTPFTNLQDAYDTALKKLGTDSKVIVMPYGGATLPQLVEN